jgi:4-amino-4-deoxy-L-arabinose transferase-like glycosyltransferase
MRRANGIAAVRGRAQFVPHLRPERTVIQQLLRWYGNMKALRFKLDLVIVGLVIAAFVAVAAQRLGTVPVPEGDEAFTLQVPYEVLNRGKLALPMLRYLGGNIENAWHSYIPVYFVILSGFHKLFGFGLAEGRAFNLMTAALTLLMIYLIGRRLFDWRAGLIAVVMLVGDQTFFERSRLLRDDYAAAAFALLAFYLYEMAEERRKAGLYVASGLAAGAGVMSHTNMLYMIGAVGLLILMREGWRAFSSRKLYLFSASALAVMAYEIVYDLIDYRNFLLQNRGDDLHFRVLDSGGIWQNLLDERLRYLKWYTGSVMFPGLPQTTLRIFQLLTIAAIVYLLIICVRRIGLGNITADPRVRVLLVTTVVVLFHALIVSHKRIYYLAHLAPWFALCVGVMLRDGLNQIGRLRHCEWPRAKLAHTAAVAAVALLTAGYGSLLAWQATVFLSKVRNPELATFSEFTSVIRSIVPEDLCPVAVQNPSIWLAFPEKDLCFATLERRMNDTVDIDGKDYALVKRNKRGGQAPATSEEGHHLLGEMNNTQYGNIVVYYTGTDPRYLALDPKRYRFFRELRGHVPETN